MEVVTTTTGIQRLVGGSSIVDSRVIWHRSIDRCRQQLLAIASDDTNVRSREVIASFLESFSIPEIGFFFHSSPIRYLIEASVSLGRSNEVAQQQGAVVYQERLISILADLVTRKATERTIDHAWLTSAGFDLQTIATQPFPAVTSIWSEPDDTPWKESQEVAELFRQAFGVHEQYQNCEVAAMPHPHVNMVFQALEYLNAVSPTISLDISLNVRQLCYYRASESIQHSVGNSFTDRHIPNCCFFSDAAFRSLPNLIESLYHESLHAKLLNTVTTFFIFSDEYDGTSPEPFMCPWLAHVPSQHEWPFDRAFAAWHVYVHLLQLYNHSQAAGTGVGSDEWVQKRLEVIREKLSILKGYLDTQFKFVLGADGAAFIAHLEQCDG